MVSFLFRLLFHFTWWLARVPKINRNCTLHRLVYFSAGACSKSLLNQNLSSTRMQSLKGYELRIWYWIPPEKFATGFGIAAISAISHQSDITDIIHTNHQGVSARDTTFLEAPPTSQKYRPRCTSPHWQWWSSCQACWMASNPTACHVWAHHPQSRSHHSPWHTRCEWGCVSASIGKATHKEERCSKHTSMWICQWWAYQHQRKKRKNNDNLMITWIIALKQWLLK